MTMLLKPGILVSAKTSVRGGVTYERRDLPLDETTEQEDGTSVARWETTRVITDPEEHERGNQARSTALSAIRRRCSTTSFGLLCSIDGEEALDKAIAEAREMTNAFNATAKHSTISVYILKGRIAETDEEATRAIADEVGGLLQEMEQGIRNLDVQAIREAAKAAKAVGEMLAEEQAAKLTSAIESARAAAREIAKRVVKAGEDGGVVLATLKTGAIERARFSFLEIGADLAIGGTPLPSVATPRFSGLDYLPEPIGDEGTEE